MKYALVLLSFLLVGCEQVQSASGRLFGNAEPVAEASVTPPEPPESEDEAQPVAQVTPGWEGAKTTIASLGDPTKPGRWLETSLVSVEVNARVVVPRTGAQAYVTLVPAPGPEGGGSRLSLDAMRALLVPFDELVELQVYLN